MAFWHDNLNMIAGTLSSLTSPSLSLSPHLYPSPMGCGWSRAVSLPSTAPVDQREGEWGREKGKCILPWTLCPNRSWHCWSHSDGQRKRAAYCGRQPPIIFLAHKCSLFNGSLHGWQEPDLAAGCHIAMATSPPQGKHSQLHSTLHTWTKEEECLHLCMCVCVCAWDYCVCPFVLPSIFICRNGQAAVYSAGCLPWHGWLSALLSVSCVLMRLIVFKAHCICVGVDAQITCKLYNNI